MPFDGVGLDAVTLRLLEGRVRIERGWCRGAFRLDEMVCAQGAILGPDGAKDAAYQEASYRLREIVGGPVVVWNDTPGRTRAEVLAVFDRAIAESAESTDSDERARSVESTIAVEWAMPAEGTKRTERARFAESAKGRERVITSESASRAERATSAESAIDRERVIATESTGKTER